MNSKEQSASNTYRRRPLRIAGWLIFSIAVLAIIQSEIGTRGWDLSAGLLTIVMVTMGFALVGVFWEILRGQSLTDEKEERNQLQESKPHWERMSDESLDNDPHVIGSAMYRGGDD